MPGSSALPPQHTSKQTKNKPGNENGVARASPGLMGYIFYLVSGVVTIAIPVAISVFLTIAIILAILAVTVVIAVFFLCHVQSVNDGT